MMNINNEELANIAIYENSMLRSGQYITPDGTKTWSWGAQAWLSSVVANRIDGCVYDDDENFDQYNWYEEALHQITKKIDLVGVAVITDDYDELLPQILRGLGYHLVPCVDFDEDNDQINWIEIFPTKEAEEDFYDNSDTELWLKTMFTEDEDNMECFLGRHLHSFMYEWEGDENEEPRYKFFAEDENGHPKAHTMFYQISHTQWEAICREIETNPKRYVIEVEKNADGKTYGVIFRRAKLEGDKYFDLTLTGREYLEVNGDWVLETDDDLNKVEVVKIVGF